MESNISLTLEQKALNILDEYQGGNNYILKLKQQKLNNKKFYPTRAQSEYIINYNEIVPKVAKKWVDIDPYFADKLASDNLYQKTPEKIWVEKLLVEKDKAYHIWGKVFSGQTLYDFWLPKQAIIKTEKIEKVVIDYSKYVERPPLEHQKEAIEKLVGSKRFILADDMGVGKAWESNTYIFTPKGKVKIGSLKIGDEVIGSNGKPTKVIGVFPQGIKELYRITFNDGYSGLVCKEHLWTVSSCNYGENSKNRDNRYITLSTGQMLDENLVLEQKGTGWNEKRPYKFKTYYKQKNGNSKWQIPIVKPIEFENNDTLPIEPYLLGLALGDGYFTKDSSITFQLHKDDFDELFEGITLTEHKTDGNKRKAHITNHRSDIKELKLEHTKSDTKFIPDIYKYSSVENRLAILQGLMDTDGHCMKSENGEFHGTEYCTASEKLADDVAEIVHSLGGIVRKKSRIGKYKKGDGTIVECKKVYRLNIKMPKQFNPFRLKRKSDLYNTPKKYKIGRYIKNIEPCGQGEAVCIAVDAPDKLYVTEHCIVTHNTTSATIAALESNAKKILIICPASLKINWERELRNYTDKSIYISEGKNFSNDEDIVIVNYDIIKNFHDIKNSNESKILNKFDLIIIDEAHMISNTQAQRTKLINSFAKNVDRLWLLTGTPITSRPINYYNLLNLINSPVAMNWIAYVIRYCNGYQFNAGKRKVWNVNGASNLEELRDRTSRQILRRLKTEVLDLPEKIITPVYLRMKSKVYEALMGEYYDWYKNKQDESSSLTVQFSKLMKVRQVIAEEKILQTIEIAENALEQDKKVIIFTNFTDTLNRIVEHFGKKCVHLDGSSSKVQRQNAVDQFQENDKIKVFVGNIKSSGVGITLTQGEVVIFNDLSFVPSDMSQAEDRAFRYGQKNSVLVYYPIFENTIEGIIYDILAKKKQIFETVMGDNLDTGDVIEEMMNKINSLK